MTRQELAPAAAAATHPRPVGLSAFIRCRNEEEYIVASVMSIYRVFDEILVVLNDSTDRTRELVEDLARKLPKIRLLEYPHRCAPIGPGYHERVLAEPDSSLASYYNWCVEQTQFSHACKWDGDMIATPLIEQVRDVFADADTVLFDGHDVLGQHTTDMEARIFRYDRRHARYVDWDLYEILQHDYSRQTYIRDKCYLHMKLVKREWLHKPWKSPNLLATRTMPQIGTAPAVGFAARLAAGVRRRLGRVAGLLKIARPR